MNNKKSKKNLSNRKKDSAIIIDTDNEEFLIISSQTCLSSCDQMIISKNLNDTTVGSIQRSGFNISMGDNIKIVRRVPFNGYQLKAREADISFNYELVDADQYDISELQYPSPSVASFCGGYSSREGCFIVSLSSKPKRVMVVGGQLDRGNSRLTAFGFPTTIAKPTHNICTAYPELMPEKYWEITNEYGESQREEIYNQINDSRGTCIRFEVQPQIFEGLNIADSGAFVIVRFELPSKPNGECGQTVLAAV